jgi:hypothetical protein
MGADNVDATLLNAEGQRPRHDRPVRLRQGYEIVGQKVITLTDEAGRQRAFPASGRTRERKTLSAKAECGAVD